MSPLRVTLLLTALATLPLVALGLRAGAASRPLRPGRRAPGLALASLDGARRIGLGGLLAAGRPVLLVFTGDDAGGLLLRSVARWQREHAAALTVAAIAGRAGAPQVARLAEAGDRCTLLLDHDGAAAHAYGLRRLPAAVLVGRDGTVAAPPATGLDAIEMLLDEALGRPPAPLRWPVPPPLLGPALGTPAPRVTVRDDAGGALALGEMLDGAPAVVLLWDPASPACEAARPALAAWPDDGPRLIAVGPAPDDRLTVPLLVDRAGAVAAAFDTVAPAAVLLDAGGRVAAPLARGADAILTLARPYATV